MSSKLGVPFLHRAVWYWTQETLPCLSPSLKGREKTTPVARFHTSIYIPSNLCLRICLSGVHIFAKERLFDQWMQCPILDSSRLLWEPLINIPEAIYSVLVLALRLKPLFSHPLQHWIAREAVISHFLLRS